MSWLSDKLKREESKLGQELDATRANLDRAIAGARRIWTELQPVVLDDLGFGDAVHAVVSDSTRHSDLVITIEMPARAMVGQGRVATALFRVVQEAVHNLVRHAGATQAAVRLVAIDDSLVLTISDNGVGFDPVPRFGKGIGLVSMRERMLGLGGVFKVDSQPGHGTRVCVTVPLSVLANEDRDEHDEETA